MKKKFSNPCSRCGKERIVLRSWTEKIDNSTILNTEMVCPNPECQKKVVTDNEKQVAKYTLWKAKGKIRAAKRTKATRLVREKKAAKNNIKR